MKLALAIFSAFFSVLSVSTIVALLYGSTKHTSICLRKINEARRFWGLSRFLIYASIVFLFLIFYFGLSTVFSWIPDSLGWPDGDGGKTPVRVYLCGFLSLFFSAYCAEIFHDFCHMKKREKSPERDGIIERFENTKIMIEREIIKFSSDPTEYVHGYFREEFPTKYSVPADEIWVKQQMGALTGAYYTLSNEIHDQAGTKLGETNSSTRGLDETSREKYDTREKPYFFENTKPSTVEISTRDDRKFIADLVTHGHWKKLHGVFEELSVKDGAENFRKNSRDLAPALRKIPGVTLPETLVLRGHYRAHMHGGITELVGIIAGQEVDYLKLANFADSDEGICSAFFFAHLAPNYGRYWHDLYDHDFSIVRDLRTLREWMVKNNIDDGSPEYARLTSIMPGLWFFSKNGYLHASALGFGLTTSMTLFSIKLRNGKIEEASRQVVAKIRGGVLY